MNIQWVAQEHDNGCGVACMAMVTGKPYAEIAQLFSGTFPHQAISDHGMQVVLCQMGYFVRRVFTAEEAGGWPPSPFADAHIASVCQPSGNGHYVVMDARGVVLDPLKPEPCRLTDWDVVYQVIGIRSP